jgi:hypothetical protein
LESGSWTLNDLIGNGLGKLKAQTADSQRPTFPSGTNTNNFRILAFPHSVIPSERSESRDPHVHIPAFTLMRKLTASLFVALLALAPSLSHAQNAAAHPDFSGTWVLDTALSDKGQMIPSKMTLKITQTPTEIAVDRQQTSQMGETTSSMKYATDGSTSKNQMTIQGNNVDVSTVSPGKALHRSSPAR